MSLTDPDATMATTARNRPLEPSYKQHTAVDDVMGAILDVAVTTGETNEGEMIEAQVDEVIKKELDEDYESATAFLQNLQRPHYTIQYPAILGLDQFD